MVTPVPRRAFPTAAPNASTGGCTSLRRRCSSRCPPWSQNLRRTKDAMAGWQEGLSLPQCNGIDPTGVHQAGRSNFLVAFPKEEYYVPVGNQNDLRTKKKRVTETEVISIPGIAS